MEELANFFHEKGRVKSFAKGQNVFLPGDSCDEVYLIKSGAVKIYDIDQEGGERTVSIFGAGRFIPIVWLLKNPEHILFFYEAISKTEVYSMSLSRAKEFIKEHPQALVKLLDMVTKGYLSNDARIFNLQRTKVPERLEFALYYLAVRLGEVDKGEATIPFSISQHEIANLAGTSRESISREMTKISSSGKVKTGHGKTYINIKKLSHKDPHRVMKI